MNIKIDTLNYYGATKKYHLNLPTLREDIEANTVIIGGGSPGVNTALELAEQGITNVVVLEARYFGYGGVGRSGDQVTTDIDHDIEAAKKHVGKEGLETLSKITNFGAGIAHERIHKYHIDADFISGYGHFVYSQRQPRALRQWEKESKTATPGEGIKLYTGKGMQQMAGSKVYCGTLKRMGGGQVYSPSMLLSSAQAIHSLEVKVFEPSPVVEVNYGKQVQIRTAMGSIKAARLLWACDSFLNNMEPEIYNKTLVTYSYQVSTEPPSDRPIECISPLRDAFSDIRPVINYYRVTRENRLLFGSATRFVEYTSNDSAAQNRTLLTGVFPYLRDVKIDFVWGGSVVCDANLFLQVDTLRGHNNVFYAQGYSGFGVTPSHIVCKILAEGINGGPDRYRLLGSIPHVTIHDCNNLCLLLVTAGKLMHQTAGFREGQS